MRPLSLKSTTSLVLCLSMATPVFGQTAQTAFPCVTADGQSVDGADALARALISSLTQADTAVPQTDPAAGPACGPDALTQATEVGGEDLRPMKPRRRFFRGRHLPRVQLMPLRQSRQ
jgi:hypothetical protein